MTTLTQDEAEKAASLFKHEVCNLRGVVDLADLHALFDSMLPEARRWCALSPLQRGRENLQHELEREKNSDVYRPERQASLESKIAYYDGLIAKERAA